MLDLDDDDGPRTIGEIIQPVLDLPAGVTIALTILCAVLLTCAFVLGFAAGGWAEALSSPPCSCDFVSPC